MEAKSGSIEELRVFMTMRRYVASRAELIARGFRLTRIRSWLRVGRLIPVIRGVYSYGRDIETPEGAWLAALAAAGPKSVLAGRTACEIWGLVARRSGIPRLIEVIRPYGEQTLLQGLSPAMRNTRIRIASRALTRSEVRQKAGFLLTSPARSLVDFAVHATAIEVRFAFLEACRLGLFNRHDVDYCFKRIEGRRGATKLRPLLSLWVPELSRIRSVLEGLFLLAWVEAGHAAPRVNEKVHGYEVDFYWPAQGLVLELDGAAYHSDPVSRRLDAKKVRDLEAQGLRVIRVSYREMKEHPERVIARIEAILAEG